MAPVTLSPWMIRSKMVRSLAIGPKTEFKSRPGIPGEDRRDIIFKSCLCESERQRCKVA